jgi:adenylate kinase family enzyme
MKIHLFGASGSGVTTTGLALASYLRFTYVDSDAYFWLPTQPPFTQRRPAAERNALIAADLALHQNWVLGGSVIHWGQEVFPSFDLIVFLYLPASIRLQRLRQRELQRYGNIIYTHPERKKQFDDFMAWCADYDYCTGLANRNIKAHRQWLSQQHAPVLLIEGDYTVEERLNRILQAIQ